MVSSKYNRSSEIKKPDAQVPTITTKMIKNTSAANAKKLARADKLWFRHSSTDF